MKPRSIGTSSCEYSVFNSTKSMGVSFHIHFLITRLWDKYLPAWRDIKEAPKKPRDPEADKKLIEELNQMLDSPDLKPHDKCDPDKVNYVTIIKDVKVRKREMAEVFRRA